MATLIKTTQDGRRVEVIGLAVTLDGRPESMDVTDIITHPRKLQIMHAAPEATHVAGRIALTREEAEKAKAALLENQAQVAANPRYAAARFQAAINSRAWQEGIE
ncbi:hypothetical protein [Novosphingobium mangrovi (ex Huang et al. 2023)]|uniref:Uncharacterized protein n=1 Tax=Novosphingobium mangrovi (ex Huang et al. 2023) TaxID=2976432 RepID=A0ABT2I267_9SPHN|nr:hypothetical protein [Novosphingobium mangrovi (ex Huang et al. 2023)]MCT2398896.1 hypothetical protein [Novosphingobium mangrovi (ex Huang et al. 2023)]